jgi:mono/diheme cytochrome c family protein
MRVLVPVFLSTLTILSAAAASQQSDPPPGRAPYQRVCAACHGENAEGGQGPRLAGISIDYDEFVAKVRHSDGEMPSIPAKEMSDEELKQVFAYLQGL